MSPVVIDTSAFISFISSTDSNHKNAALISHILKRNKTPVFLPGEIFTEIINVFGKKISHQAAADTTTTILRSKDFTIVETTPKIRANAVEKFQSQPRSVSFTDCLVMAFADEYQTKHIFAFDEHFKKNGYVRFGIDGK